MLFFFALMSRMDIRDESIEQHINIIIGTLLLVRFVLENIWSCSFLLQSLWTWPTARLTNLLKNIYKNFTHISPILISPWCGNIYVWARWVTPCTQTSTSLKLIVMWFVFFLRRSTNWPREWLNRIGRWDSNSGSWSHQRHSNLQLELSGSRRWVMWLGWGRAVDIRFNFGM